MPIELLVLCPRNNLHICRSPILWRRTVLHICRSPILWRRTVGKGFPTYDLCKKFTGHHISLSALLLAVGSFIFANTALGADIFPAKSIRMVVPFPPGGGTDISARVISPPMSAGLGQSVVVDNRSGASGIIGTDIVAKSAPDGYTIVAAIINHVTNPALYAVPFDPINDFAPIGLLTKNPQILVVNASLPVKSVGELVALGRSGRDKVVFASGGIGSPSHLAAELLKGAARISMVHVPYKGSAPAILDLVGGRVTFTFSSLPSALNLIKLEKLRGLAVTGLARSLLLPEVPTIAESGFPGFEMTAWLGLLAPAKTPAAAIASLNAASREALSRQEVTERLFTLGYEPAAGSPEEFRTYLRSEMDKWAKIIKDHGIKAK